MCCCLWSCFDLGTFIAALIAALGHWGEAECQSHNSENRDGTCVETVA